MKHRFLWFCILMLLSHLVGSTTEFTEVSTKTTSLKHFMWGVDFGSTIDMSGNDMSSIDIDAYFGYKNSFFRAIGVGASIHSALGNDFAFMPVYFIMRTSFTTHPSLCFVDLRGGYSFNTLSKNISQNAPFASIGLGINLYCTNKFKSHIILAYSYQKIDKYSVGDEVIDFNDLNGASIRIGISF